MSKYNQDHLFSLNKLKPIQLKKNLFNKEKLKKVKIRSNVKLKFNRYLVFLRVKMHLLKKAMLNK